MLGCWDRLVLLVTLAIDEYICSYPTLMNFERVFGLRGSIWETRSYDGVFCLLLLFFFSQFLDYLKLGFSGWENEHLQALVSFACWGCIIIVTLGFIFL